MDCIGHVQKRMGTALRKLKKETKALRVRGALADTTIDSFQNYYGLAVQNNIGDVDKMHNATMAILYHSHSEHLYCPDHSEQSPSWCKYKRESVTIKGKVITGGKKNWRKEKPWRKCP